MQQPPHIDGLPLVWQLVISLIFGMAALGAAYSGYFKRGSKAATASTEQSSTTAILAASITDGFATRSLNESVVRLDESVKTLTDAIADQTHHERNSVEVSRELCGRVRELTEELRRQRG